MNRGPDWWRQAQADFRHAQNALADGDWEWSAFAAQQAGEKALKALVLALGGVGWGHSLLQLVVGLRQKLPVPPEVEGAARRLDRHYLPSRYPNGWPAGAPTDYYDQREAQEALANARQILEFVSRHLP